MKSSIEEQYTAIISGIKDYFSKNDVKKAVIGISGGLDSAVAGYCVVKALGNKNVVGILLPDYGVTSKESMKDAEAVVKKLKVSSHTVFINNFIEQFESINKNLKLKSDIKAIANAKARTRMMILYYIAQLNNALVIGTSDKSEIALGYTTKFGDSASDILVIGDMWKTDVIELGKFLKIPESIVKKKPSAELIPGQTAEKELGAPYSTMDKILKLYIEEDLSANDIIEKGFNAKIVKTIVKRLKNNEHKRRMPMIIRLSERSFHGTEWRMPITNKFEE